jgi:hypothetical protein
MFEPLCTLIHIFWENFYLVVVVEVKYPWITLLVCMGITFFLICNILFCFLFALSILAQCKGKASLESKWWVRGGGVRLFEGIARRVPKLKNNVTTYLSLPFLNNLNSSSLRHLINLLTCLVNDFAIPPPVR